MNRQVAADPAARAWFSIAVGSLLLAGAFALFLVLGRMPPFDKWVTDPTFFKRCLVVHVVLALVVWFNAFLGLLYCLLPGGRRPRLGLFGALVTTVGVAMIAGIGIGTSAAPILSNYIPTLDHPGFLAGLFVMAVGLVLTFFDGRLMPPRPGSSRSFLPDSACAGVRAAVVLFVLAVACFVAAALVTPPELPAQARFELLFWGGGHVLQVAAEVGMLVVWLVLVSTILGRSPVSARTATILFGVLVVPMFVAPLVTMAGTTQSLYQLFFTRAMQWTIFPVVIAFLVLCTRALRQAFRSGELDRSSLRDPRFIGLVVSVSLALAGFVLGAMIRGPNTMVPAHYHAAIGAVTAAYMTLTPSLLSHLGTPLERPLLVRSLPWQPVLFGAGQLVFALGFALAGMSGMTRKTYGAEQALRTPLETFGLKVMGLGGIIALIGGLLFLWIVLSAWWNRVGRTLLHRRTSWQRTRSTPSNA